MPPMQAMALGDFRDMAREAINAAPKGEEGREPNPEELERQVSAGVGQCGCCWRAAGRVAPWTGMCQPRGSGSLWHDMNWRVT